MNRALILRMLLSTKPFCYLNMNRLRKLVGQATPHGGGKASHSSGSDLSGVALDLKTPDGNLEVFDIKANTFDPNLPGKFTSGRFSF
jgi:hypothetical protein